MSTSLKVPPIRGLGILPSMSENPLTRALPDSSSAWREMIAVILVSVTTVLTAWTAFQASKWGGEMSIAFSNAASQRADAIRYEAVVNRQISVQVSLFSQWVQATASGDEQLAEFWRDRFPEPLASSMNAWLEQDPLQSTDAPTSPFDMPEYVSAESEAALQAALKAKEASETALRNNQFSDNYTVLTILFATVLFFGAVSGRVRRPVNSWILLGIALLIFSGSAAVLATFPKLV